MVRARKDAEHPFNDAIEVDLIDPWHDTPKRATVIA